MKKIPIYGKGVIGKSAPVSNVSTAQIKAPVICRQPRHCLVKQAQAQGKTVVETYFGCDTAAHFLRLSKILLEGG